MSAPPALVAAGHLHVTEREAKHRLPDGSWDDASWEDCTFVAGLELARICHDVSLPATHAEAEALRSESGRGPLGGTSTADLRRALEARYGWTGWREVAGADPLWSSMAPGTAAAAQGRLTAFPAGHRLRRWDPTFAGGHDVLIVRLDDRPRVWWCDPLAPQNGSYEGEWVSHAELDAYVSAFAGSALVAPITREDTVSIYLPAPGSRPGVFVIPANRTFRVYVPTAGGGWAVDRTWAPRPVASSGRYTAHLVAVGASSRPASVLYVSPEDGGFAAGGYVSTAEVEEHPEPIGTPAPGDCGPTVALDRQRILGHVDSLVTLIKSGA